MLNWPVAEVGVKGGSSLGYKFFTTMQVSLIPHPQGSKAEEAPANGIQIFLKKSFWVTFKKVSKSYDAEHSELKI